MSVNDGKYSLNGRVLRAGSQVQEVHVYRVHGVSNQFGRNVLKRRYVDMPFVGFASGTNRTRGTEGRDRLGGGMGPSQI